jgi:hypothetical protein
MVCMCAMTGSTYMSSNFFTTHFFTSVASASVSCMFVAETKSRPLVGMRAGTEKRLRQISSTSANVPDVRFENELNWCRRAFPIG